MIMIMIMVIIIIISSSCSCSCNSKRRPSVLHKKGKVKRGNNDNRLLHVPVPTWCSEGSFSQAPSFPEE